MKKQLLKLLNKSASYIVAKTQDYDDEILSNCEFGNENQLESNGNIGETKGDFEQLLIRCVELIKQYDIYAQQMPEGELKVLLADVSFQLINALILSGCKPIIDDVKFDMLRHVPMPFSVVDNGVNIKKTLRPGIMRDNRVYLVAQVEI